MVMTDGVYISAPIPTVNFPTTTVNLPATTVNLPATTETLPATTVTFSTTTETLPTTPAMAWTSWEQWSSCHKDGETVIRTRSSRLCAHNRRNCNGTKTENSTCAIGNYAMCSLFCILTVVNSVCWHDHL